MKITGLIIGLFIAILIVGFLVACMIIDGDDYDKK